MPAEEPAMSATAFANNHHNIAQRAAATRRLAELAHYLFGVGFLPDIAAIAAGYKHPAARSNAARRAARPELAAALTNPTPAEKRAAQIEDIEFLLDRREDPERAAHRCGFTSAYMAEK